MNLYNSSENLTTLKKTCTRAFNDVMGALFIADRVIGLYLFLYMKNHSDMKYHQRLIEDGGLQNLQVALEETIPG